MRQGFIASVVALVILLTVSTTNAQVPDFRLTVQTLARVADLRTLEGCGAFTRSVVSSIHPSDARFGHLRKPSWRTHVVDAAGNRHAADVILFRETGQIVDIARDCAGIDPAPSWSVGPMNEYDPNALIDGLPTWFGPTPTTPNPTPSPQPPPLDLSGVYGRLDQLDARVVEIALQNERIFAYEKERLDHIEVVVVELDRKVTSTWRKLVGFIKDPRVIAVVGGLVAGRFAWPTSTPPPTTPE